MSAFDDWVMDYYEEIWEEQEEEDGASQYSISVFCNTLDYRSDVMSLLETFTFGLCLGALCAIFFVIGWRMGIQNYLRRAREHVEKFGNKLWQIHQKKRNTQPSVIN